ncbi:MAG: SPW repeat protein [Minisyncoccota bacterium]
MWQKWVNALLGLWIIAVPFLGMTGSALMWTLVISGILVAVFSLWGMQDISTESTMSHRPQHQ